MREEACASQGLQIRADPSEGFPRSGSEEPQGAVKGALQTTRVSPAGRHPGSPVPTENPGPPHPELLSQEEGTLVRATLVLVKSGVVGLHHLRVNGYL